MLVDAVQAGEHRVDLAGERALGEVAVHPHSEVGERALHPFDHQRDALQGQLVRVRLGGALDLPGQLGHVGAAVLLGLLTAGARLDRLAELAHLAAGVVHVVLALHAVARPLEDPGQRVAVGGVARRGHGERPRGVGGHELHEHPLARRPAAELVARLQHGRQRVEVPGLGHEQVEEARPGDLDPLHGGAEPPAELVAQPLGDRARRLAQRGSQQHRRVGGVVAEVGARRAIEPAARSCGRRRPARRRRL